MMTDTTTPPPVWLMKFTGRGTGADIYVPASQFRGMIVGGNGGAIRDNDTAATWQTTTLILEGWPNDGRVTVEDTPEAVRKQLWKAGWTYDPVTPVPAPAPAGA